MSSKQPAYLQLTRANYEEAFLLYVDGELSPEGMEAVDAFAAIHPDLREELDLLLETRLDAEPVSLGDLGFLHSTQMQRSLHSEDLLSYIDNELPADRREALESALAADPALHGELALLQSAKLPAEVVACPFKEELYRREEKRRPLFWLPRVAAAVLLLGAGALLWQMNRSAQTVSPQNDGSGSIAKKTTPPQPVIDAAAQERITPPTATNVVARTDAQATKQDRTSTDKPAQTPQVASQPVKSQVKDRGAVAPQPQPLPQAPVQQQIAYEPDPRDRTPVVNGSNYTPPANETLAEAPVTSPAVAALNPQSNDAQPAASEAVYREEPRQGSVRGFLRKASRFLEKRTGIKTTNDDNQLVVGGVAINLK